MPCCWSKSKSSIRGQFCWRTPVVYFRYSGYAGSIVNSSFYCCDLQYLILRLSADSQPSFWNDRIQDPYRHDAERTFIPTVLVIYWMVYISAAPDLYLILACHSQNIITVVVPLMNLVTGNYKWCSSDAILQAITIHHRGYPRTSLTDSLCP